VCDCANLFAEPAMAHGLSDAPHFAIREPRYKPTDIEGNGDSR